MTDEPKKPEWQRPTLESINNLDLDPSTQMQLLRSAIIALGHLSRGRYDLARDALKAAIVITINKATRK